MDDNTHQRFRAAMRSQTAFPALVELAQTLKHDGASQADLYRLFVWYQHRLSPDDPAYDAVVDTLDLVCGGPWAKGRDLFPTQLIPTADQEPSPLREPWVPLTGDGKLEDEARREIGRGHVLWNKELRAIARRLDRDDVLFGLRQTPQVASVHLTWSGKRESPPWPSAVIYPTMLEWFENLETELEA